MLLSDYVAHYAAARDLRESTINQYRFTVQSFSRFAGLIELCKITAEAINAWLESLKAAGKSSWTIAGNRTRLKVLLTAAEDEKLIDRVPKIRRVKKHRLCPSAWSPLELCRLLAACDLESSRFRKCETIKPASFWRAFVLTAYYSGMRLGDLLDLRWSQIHDGGVLVRLQEKTGTPICTRLPDDCLAMLAAIKLARIGSLLVFGGLRIKRDIQKQLAKIRKRAGLADGGSQKLRRSGATAVELDQPGSATYFLGHLTPGLAQRHYLDQAKLHRDNPIPRTIG